MPFDAFNGITQPVGSNECGAYALAAALTNFGLADLSPQANLLNTADLTTGYNQPGHVVTNTGGAQAFATSIYPITGNLQLTPPVAPPPATGTATYRYQAPVSDMNSPSALVYVATLFGYAPAEIAIRYTNAGETMFNMFNVTDVGNGGTLLNTEIQLLASISQNLVIVGPMDYTGIPNATHVQMVVVNNGSHWLAINNTQLYDPATGYVGAYTLSTVGPLSFNYVMATIPHNNSFSGVWIELDGQ